MSGDDPGASSEPPPKPGRDGRSGAGTDGTDGADDGADPLAWETRERRVAYACEGFDVVNERVRLPDGTEAEFDYLHDGPSVVVLPFLAPRAAVAGGDAGDAGAGGTADGDDGGPRADDAGADGADGEAPRPDGDGAGGDPDAGGADGAADAGGAGGDAGTDPGGGPAGDPAMVVIEEWRQAVGRVNRALPAGGMEPGESVPAAARRELREETGYRAGRVETLTTVEPANGFSDAVFHYVRAFDCAPADAGQRLDRDESIRVETTTRSALRGAVLDGSIRDGRTALGVLYDALLEG